MASKGNLKKQLEYFKYYRPQTSLDKFFLRSALRTVGLSLQFKNVVISPEYPYI